MFITPTTAAGSLASRADKRHEPPRQLRLVREERYPGGFTAGGGCVGDIHGRLYGLEPNGRPTSVTVAEPNTGFTSVSGVLITDTTGGWHVVTNSPDKSVVNKLTISTAPNVINAVTRLPSRSLGYPTRRPGRTPISRWQPRPTWSRLVLRPTRSLQPALALKCDD